MTIKQKKRPFWRSFSFCLMSFVYVTESCAADAEQLESIEIHTHTHDDTSGQHQSLDVDELSQQSSGETLGDYLNNQPNVRSASYGPGVGRPVIKGMTGYRVKILQNDIEVSDMSAMSQDHAVAVMPKASRRIELLKGPASVLYGAKAGGLVRVVDSETGVMPEAGIHGKLATSASNNNNSTSLTAELSAANDTFAVALSGVLSDAENYHDGDDNEIQDSDMLSRQGQVSLSWQTDNFGLLQFKTTQLAKDYGIPNNTAEQTGIEMQSKIMQFNWSKQNVSAYIDQLELSYSHTDYRHSETEANRNDGLFDQQTHDLQLKANYVWQDWTGRMLVSAQQKTLQVCHEHGRCDDFEKDSRTLDSNLGLSILQQLQDEGHPYSHGHPVPDTQTQRLQFGLQAETETASLFSAESAILSLGTHLEQRGVSVSSDNIQETWVIPDSVDSKAYANQNDWAGSLSIGYEQPLGNNKNWALNLSYLERLPSVDELFWNGFHHATDSYIFGDRNLKKEKSYNLDWDWVADIDSSVLKGHWEVNLFYYHFEDYIFQETLHDAQGNPEVYTFHPNSEVWHTRQADANFYGGSISYDRPLFKWQNNPIVLQNQFDILQAKLSNGENLPRTAPQNWLLGLNYQTQTWKTNLQLKTVFESEQLAENESKTKGYQWLTAYVEKSQKTNWGNWKIWLKGENLLNQQAYNHLSFLKETAPLKGRSFTVGISGEF